MFLASNDCGWKFPVRVDKSTGKIMMSQGDEDVKEAVKIIIQTSKKERIMRPGFGSNLRSYLFDLGNLGTMTLIEDEIKEAIENWEPRVTDVAVTASYDSSMQEKISVDVSYRIKSSEISYQNSILIDV